MVSNKNAILPCDSPTKDNANKCICEKKSHLKPTSDWYGAIFIGEEVLSLFPGMAPPIGTLWRGRNFMLNVRKQP
jgi:hypothetical protein